MSHATFGSLDGIQTARQGPETQPRTGLCHFNGTDTSVACWCTSGTCLDVSGLPHWNRTKLYPQPLLNLARSSAHTTFFRAHTVFGRVPPCAGKENGLPGPLVTSASTPNLRMLSRVLDRFLDVYGYINI